MTTRPARPADLTPDRAAPGQTGSCCAGLSRRGFLGATLAGSVATFGSTLVATGPRAAAATGSMASAASAAPAGTALVLLSLRGAVDGLSLVVPHGDPGYLPARPGIGIATDRLLWRDDMFGMHPALAPLEPLWRAGRLAAVQATGLAMPNRSHFAAMEEIEDADPGSPQRVGWLNRMIGELTAGGPAGDPLAGIALGTQIPAALAGDAPVLSLRSLDDSVIAGTDDDGRRARALHTTWDGETSGLARAFQRAMTATGGLDGARAQPDRVASYPDSDLGRALSSVARTLRADVGVRTVTVDSGDWDMHSGLGRPENGWMRRNTTDLAAGIAAFFADLGPYADRVTLVTLSEFGRRVEENSAGGLDHGWGNVMLLAGAGVRGGYYGRWPGLGTGTAAELTVTTDYRSVLAEVVTRRMGASAATVFPGFSPEPVGVIQAV